MASLSSKIRQGLIAWLASADKEKIDIKNVNALASDELFTAFSGATMVKTSDQTIANTTGTKVTWEEANELNLNAPAFGDTSNNGVTIPNSDYSMAKVTAGFRFASAVPIEDFFPRVNDLIIPDGGGIIFPDGNVTTTGDMLESAWFPVSSGDTLTVDIQQSSGGNATLVDNDSQTFLSVIAV